MPKPPVEPIYREVEAYIEGLFAQEDDALAGVERSMEAAGMPQISVAPVEGKLLALLAQSVGARRILEIGTLGGYSTIWLARALPAGGELITLEVSETNAAVAQSNLEKAGVADRVRIRLGRALDTLSLLHAEKQTPFDFVFIDADKTPYLDYFEWAMKLTRMGSLIVADNVIRSGNVLNAESEDELVRGVQRFSTAVAADPRVSTVILQTVGAKGHDGMAISLVK